MYIARKYQKKLHYPINDTVNGLKIDLCTDMDDLLGQQLEKAKVKGKNPNDPSMDFFRLQQRLITNRPRKVIKAKEFTCPKSHEEALKHIENCIMQGKDLHPFMTRNLRQLKNEDILLSDWGIYHLHLSCKLDAKKKDGFMERSKYLLMVKITDNTAYFIKTVPHNEKNRWARKEYIQIIRDNWPELIENNLMKDMHLTEKISDTDYEKLRKAHISTFVELDDGSLYTMLGGGYMSDGTSSNAIRAHDYYQEIVTSAEEFLIRRLKRKLAQEVGLSGDLGPNETIEVHLVSIDIGTLFLKVERTNLIIRMVIAEDQNWTIQIITNNMLLRKMMNEKSSV